MNAVHVVLGALLLFPALQDSKPAPTKADAVAEKEAAIQEQLPSYPLTTCPVSGEPLGDGAENVLADGTLVRTCCGKCAKLVTNSPEKYAAQVRDAVVAAQKPTYPMTTCPISGEPLGETAVDHVHGTRLVRLCCANCVEAFEKEPAKAMELVDAALIAAQIESYPAKACPVSGEALGSMGDPVDVLYGTRLVRLCCKGCMKSYAKDRARYVAMVYPAPDKKPTGDTKHGK